MHAACTVHDAALAVMPRWQDYWHVMMLTDRFTRRVCCHVLCCLQAIKVPVGEELPVKRAEMLFNRLMGASSHPQVSSPHEAAPSACVVPLTS